MGFGLLGFGTFVFEASVQSFRASEGSSCGVLVVESSENLGLEGLGSKARLLDLCGCWLTEFTLFGRTRSLSTQVFRLSQ